jgi:hypothetical protein
MVALSLAAASFSERDIGFTGIQIHLEEQAEQALAFPLLVWQKTREIRRSESS